MLAAFGPVAFIPIEAADVEIYRITMLDKYIYISFLAYCAEIVTTNQRNVLAFFGEPPARVSQ
jgi:hypothetical protein